MNTNAPAVKLNPYLTFPGTAADAIELYKEVFRAEPASVQLFKEIPPGEDMVFSAAGGERIMHAAFQVGNDSLMLSDAAEGQDDTVVSGSQMHVSFNPASKDDADRVFALLVDGGETTMPMTLQFWGDYFGMCRDKFGIQWMINFNEAG